MTLTSQRAVRPVFDDLEGRHLLSMLSPIGRSPSAPAVTTFLAKPMSLDTPSGLGGVTHRGNSSHAGQVSAASIQAGTYFLRDKATGFNLDSNAARSVYTHSYNGGSYQKWVFRPSGDGSTFYLRDDATGFYLSGRGSPHHAKMDDGDGSNYQRWRLFPSGDGYYFLQNKATGLFLDSNADNAVYELPYNGGSYQQWRLTGTTP